jgi:FYVE/RhoGEF/PH domain-containing protein 1
MCHLLLLQVFHFRVDQENRAQNLFPADTVQHMFANIKSIYSFHNDFLLPQVRLLFKNGH